MIGGKVGALLYFIGPFPSRTKKLKTVVAGFWSPFSVLGRGSDCGSIQAPFRFVWEVGGCITGDVICGPNRIDELTRLSGMSTLARSKRIKGIH